MRHICRTVGNCTIYGRMGRTEMCTVPGKTEIRVMREVTCTASDGKADDEERCVVHGELAGPSPNTAASLNTMDSSVSGAMITPNTLSIINY